MYFLQMEAAQTTLKMQKTLKETIDDNVLISKNIVITALTPLTRRVACTGVAVRSLMVACTAQIIDMIEAIVWTAYQHLR